MLLDGEDVSRFRGAFGEYRGELAGLLPLLGVNPQAEHLLDWSHTTKRITVMMQLARGCASRPCCRPPSPPSCNG